MKSGAPVRWHRRPRRCGPGLLPALGVPRRAKPASTPSCSRLVGSGEERGLCVPRRFFLEGPTTKAAPRRARGQAPSSPLPPALSFRALDSPGGEESQSKRPAAIDILRFAQDDKRRNQGAARNAGCAVLVGLFPRRPEGLRPQERKRKVHWGRAPFL